MKVEFWPSSNEEKYKLIISGTEFLKADKNPDEFNSLAASTDAYAGMNGINWFLDKATYRVVKTYVSKDVDVVIEAQCFRNNCWCDIYTSGHEHIMYIQYSDDNGRHIELLPERQSTRRK